MAPLRDQFAHPEGLGGRVAGWLMALSNRELNSWAVDLLEVRPNDRVLEVGFGPGLAVQELARRARNGYVAGVDTSPLMVRQASQRNAAAIRARRVDLRVAGVSAIPFADADFTRALAVNSIQFWPNPDADLRELMRVLRPGGRLAIVLQPRWAPTEAEVLSVRDELIERVRAAGYTNVRGVVNPLKPMPAFAVIATKP